MKWKKLHCHLLTLVNLVLFQDLQLILLSYWCSTAGCALRISSTVRKYFSRLQAFIDLCFHLPPAATRQDVLVINQEAVSKECYQQTTQGASQATTQNRPIKELHFQRPKRPWHLHLAQDHRSQCNESCKISSSKHKRRSLKTSQRTLFSRSPQAKLSQTFLSLFSPLSS